MRQIIIKKNISIFIINSQITKARDITHISINLFNSFTIKWLYFVNIIFEKRKVSIISKLVGISEAIRLILIQFKLRNISLKNQILILAIFIIILVIFNLCGLHLHLLLYLHLHLHLQQAFFFCVRLRVIYKRVFTP